MHLTYSVPISLFCLRESYIFLPIWSWFLLVLRNFSVGYLFCIFTCCPLLWCFLFSALNVLTSLHLKTRKTSCNLSLLVNCYYPFPFPLLSGFMKRAVGTYCLYFLTLSFIHWLFWIFLLLYKDKNTNDLLPNPIIISQFFFLFHVSIIYYVDLLLESSCFSKELLTQICFLNLGCCFLVFFTVSCFSISLSVSSLPYLSMLVFLKVCPWWSFSFFSDSVIAV